MTVYTTTQINDSSVVSLPAGEAITDVRGHAVKFDSSGKMVLAGAGDAPFGVGIITNDEGTASGANIDVQYKNIGLVYAGGSFAAGKPLSVDSNGCFVAASGVPGVAIALQAAAAAGVYVRALLKTGYGYGDVVAPASVTSVNGKTGTVTIAASDVGAVPTTRTINSKPLSADITLTASDVGAEPAQN